MAKLFAITLTAFQETFRRRVFYVVILLTVLIVIIISSQIFFLRMARQAGETQMITDMGQNFIQSVLGIWNFAALFLAFFLGAIAVSSEISAKTIIHVMSRPVERWIYLLGRWLGVLLFLWLFLFVGIAGALLISLWLNVPIVPMLWLVFAEMYVSAIYYSGLALAFSVFTPPVLAGVLAFLLTILPAVGHNALNDPRPLHYIPALIGYYLGPARMPVNLIQESFSKTQLHTDYFLYLRVLGENIFYVIAALLVATSLFRRRELRVR